MTWEWFALAQHCRTAVVYGVDGTLGSVCPRVPARQYNFYIGEHAVD